MNQILLSVFVLQPLLDIFLYIFKLASAIGAQVGRITHVPSHWFCKPLFPFYLFLYFYLFVEILVDLFYDM